MNPSANNIDLSSCDREPIQSIAAIQGHGLLIAFNPADLRLTNVSENAGDVLIGRPGEILAKRLDQVFPADFVEKVRHSMRRSPDEIDFFAYHGRLGNEADPQTYDCYIYPNQGLICLEIEAQPPETDASSTQSVLCAYTREMSEQANFQAAAKVLARGIRRLTGMDRVMIYRFMPKVWHGEVIAEDRVASSHAFLGHRFPATDIPKPARDLYLRNRLRFIKDPAANGSRITPTLNPTTGRVLDLGDSRLRAVAPVHLQYLKNMKVASSFSVAIVAEGALWGLVACHHFEPMSLPYIVRQACEALGASFAGRLTFEEKAGYQQRHLGALHHVQELVMRLRDSTTPVKDFFANHRVVDEIFSASGMALVQNGRVESAGLVPPPEKVAQLAELMNVEMTKHNRPWWASESIGALRKDFVEFKMAASGVLAVRVPGTHDAFFMLFRPEALRTIQWGGDPRKQLDRRNYEGPINPRASFESWTERIEATSIEWTAEEIRSARFLVDLVFQTFLEKERLMSELLEKRGRV